MGHVSTCEDYDCRWDGKGEHSHVGVQPYLHRVHNAEGKLVDGETGEVIIGPEVAEAIQNG